MKLDEMTLWRMPTSTMSPETGPSTTSGSPWRISVNILGVRHSIKGDRVQRLGFTKSFVTGSSTLFRLGFGVSGDSSGV